MGHFGLTIARDVVEFALDGEQRSIRDRLRRDAFTIDDPLTFRQQEFLKHDAYRVEVVLGRHIENSVVFIVELPVRLGAVPVAFDQMVVELPVRVEMAVRIHRQEARVLQKAGIDLAGIAGIVIRHTLDQTSCKP